MDTQSVSEGEQRFRELADNAPVLIWRSKPDMSFDWFNAVWLSFRGRTMEEELGYGFADGIHPDDRDECATIYLDAFEARQSFSMEYRLQRHDGAYCWFLCNGRPYRHADGHFGGYFGSCTDISQQKEAIAQKDLMLRELQHRVRNNMQLISSLLTLRIGAARDEAVRDELKAIQHRVFALAQAQQRLHEDGPVQSLDFGAHLEELCASVAGLLGDGRCTIEVRAEPHAVPADQAILLTMIANELMLGACGRFAPQSGRIIDVEFAHEAGENRLVVADREEGPSNLDEGGGHDPADARILQALVASLDGRVEVERAAGRTRIVVRYPEPPET
jgi:PAS domain S-box-containing protein